jgi:hypothetical protein
MFGRAAIARSKIRTPESREEPSDPVAPRAVALALASTATASTAISPAKRETAWTVPVAVASARPLAVARTLPAIAPVMTDPLAYLYPPAAAERAGGADTAAA